MGSLRELIDIVSKMNQFEVKKIHQPKRRLYIKHVRTTIRRGGQNRKVGCLNL